MLYKEFFSQGDLEKAIGRNPMEMMDRERASIPDLQIGFIDQIVLPAFRYVVDRLHSSHPDAVIEISVGNRAFNPVCIIS